MERSIIDCCKKLTSEKQTERKNAAEKIQLLLQHDEVIQLLDSRTTNSSSGLDAITWNEVYESVCSFVRLEAEALSKSSTKVYHASSSLPSLEKRKTNVTNLYRTTIHTINKRGLILSAQCIIGHMVKVLKSQAMRKLFGGDYSKILLKEFLSIWKYQCDMLDEHWNDLINLYCDLLLEACRLDRTSIGYDRQVLIEVLIRLLVGARKHSQAIYNRCLFKFFENIFDMVDQKLDVHIFKGILSAWNHFQLAVAINYRRYVCRIGERILRCALEMWNKSRSDCKDEIVLFMKIQLAVRYPNGTDNTVDGADVHLSADWKKNMQDLLELLESEALTKNKISNISFSHLYVDVMGDILHQVTKMQDYASDNLSTEESPRKKTKVESKWTEMQSRLSSSQDNDICAWLQLFTTVINKYPDDLSPMHYQQFFKILLNLRSRFKRRDILNLIFRAERSLLAACHTKAEKKSSLEFEEVTLRNYWKETWRFVNSKEYDDPALSVLTYLLSRNSMNSFSIPWEVVFNGSVGPTKSGLDFLITYLRKYDLPECASITSTSIAVTVLHPLRCQLMKWLLPFIDNDDFNDDGTTTVYPKLRQVLQRFRINPEIISNILIALTRRQVGLLPALENISFDHDSSMDDCDLRLTEIREVYQSFRKNAEENKNKSTNCTPIGNGTCAKNLVKYLLDLLNQSTKRINEFSHFIEIDKTSMKSKSSEILLVGLAWHCCIISKIFYSLIQSNYISESELRNSDTFQSMNTMLQLSLTVINQSIRTSTSSINYKDEDSFLTKFLRILIKMFPCENLFKSTISESERTSRLSFGFTLLREVFPESLLNLLFQILEGKQNEGTKLRNTNLSSDEFDIEGQPASRNKSIPALVNSDRQNPWLENINRLERERIACAEFLSKAYSYNSSSGNNNIPISADLRIDSKVLHTLYNPRLKDILSRQTPLECIRKPVDLQLFFKCGNILAFKDSDLPAEDLQVLLELLLAIIRNNKWDNIICVEGLRMLHSLSQHFMPLKYYCNKRVVDSCREICCTILTAFWKLLSATSYKRSYSTNVKIQFAKCLLQYIKINSSSQCCNQITDAAAADKSIKEMYLTLLGDDDHEVRMFVSTSLASVFAKYKFEKCFRSNNKTEVCSQLPKVEQQKIYDEVEATILELINFKESNRSDSDTGDLHHDLTNNKTHSVLATLATIAINVAVCEKKALFLIFRIAQNSKHYLDIIYKILTRVAQSLNYERVDRYLRPHLGYIIHRWLKENLKVLEFPFQLLGLSDQSLKELDMQRFIQEYQLELIPRIIANGDSSQLKTVVQIARQNIEEVVSRCFSYCVVSIFPSLGISDEKSTPKTEIESSLARKALTSYHIIEQLLSKDTVRKLVCQKIDDIVVNLLSCLYETPSEPSDTARFTKDDDPEPNPPYYTAYTIRDTLDYIVNSWLKRKTDKSILVSLLGNSKDGIQSVLLSLAMRLDKAHFVYERRRELCMYRLFVQLLLKEFPNGFRNNAAFILRDIIFTLLRTMSKPCKKRIIDVGNNSTKAVINAYEDDIINGCLELLKLVCEAGLKKLPTEFSQHLQVVITTLVPIAERQDAVGKNAKGMINYLISDNERPCEYIEALKSLDLLPKLSSFTELINIQKDKRESVSLLQELESLADGSSYTSSAYRLDGIRFIKKLLERSRNDFVKLDSPEYDQLLAKVIHKLLQLNRSSEMTNLFSTNVSDISCQIQEEASRCLGELGAVSLNPVALNSCKKSYELEVNSSHDEEKRTVMLLNYLSNFLINHDVKIVQAASKCLKSILSLPKCKELLVSSRLHHYGLNLYLTPFTDMLAPSTSIDSPNSDYQLSALNRVVRRFFDSKLSIPHSEWIVQLTSELASCAQDAILQRLGSLYALEAEFAEFSFPYLVKDIVSSFGHDARAIFSHSLQTFLSKANVKGVSNDYNVVKNSQSDSTKVVSNSNKESYKAILEMINYLRTQEKPGSKTPWGNNFWLDLNFLDLARVAQSCDAYYTSLLYIEIWHNYRQELDEDEELDETNYHSLLTKAYSNIGEPDYVYGIESQHLASLAGRVEMYRHEDKWNQALSVYDIQSQYAIKYPSAARPSNELHDLTLIDSMRNAGLYHSMEMCLTTLLTRYPDKSSEVSEYLYENAWRSTCWTEISLDTQKLIPTDGFHCNLYKSIRAIDDKDELTLTTLIKKSRSGIMKEISENSLESITRMYDSMMKLQQLLELEEFGRYIFDGLDLADLFKEWDQRLSTHNLKSDFSLIEPIITLRCTSLNLILASNYPQYNISNPQYKVEVAPILNALTKHLQMYAKLARQAGRYQLAENVLFRWKQLLIKYNQDKVDICSNWHCQLEESQLFWAKGEQDVCKCIMQSLISDIERQQKSNGYNDNNVKALYCRALGLYGKWLGDSYSENPNNIIENYLSKSIQLLQNSIEEMQSISIDAFLSLGCYADAQYQKIVTYLKSNEFEEKKHLIRQSKSDLELLKGTKSVNTQDNARRYKKLLEIQSRIDESEEKQLLDDKIKFLKLAITNYIHCLQFGDDHDVRVFRLCSLWFENWQYHNINEIIGQEQLKIQSKKFLPLMYQLAARMGSSTAEKLFTDSLNQIIFRTAQEHPFHTLPVILALSNAKKDFTYIGDSLSKNSSESLKARSNTNKRDSLLVDQKLTDAARNMIARLSFSKIGNLIDTLEGLCNAYIELAYSEVPHQYRYMRTSVPIPSDLALLKINASHQAPMLTCDIKIDPTCEYENVIYIEQIESHFRLVGGINLPKIISCIGTDGVTRQQLVKGKDDLRQDAVMQQVFCLVNILLSSDVEASKRKLRIRTYKVIPLSQRSGIVEWCENTQPIGQYLLGGSDIKLHGAHKRYNPKDWASMDCKRKLVNSTNKLHSYHEITDHFHPVFRHFFFENFLNPVEWFERRLAYTRSVAASSIVGYVVGLGDRHVQNILVDRTTAELIHIDFGIAFEQGRVLPTPETVPFRLTRDIVDGMGITGVEGVFRRCCEKTMAVMRHSQDSLLTILEVLLYDPLYAWNISPLKAIALQRRRSKDHGSTENTGNEDSSGTPSGDEELLDYYKRGDKTTQDKSSGNKMAERALLRVRQKLNGTENGIVLSISGQVNHLIHEAREPKNLSKLFHGWQAWV